MVIIKHLDFNPDHAIENLRWFKTWQKWLPLQTIKSHKIPINDKKTPSTYCTEKPAYTFSIKEHLHCVLNNPELMKKMHFNYSIEARVKSELWYGETWHKSLLYSNTTIMVRNGIYLEFFAYLSHFLVTFITCYLKLILLLFLVQYTLGDWVTFNFREVDNTIIERVGRIEAIV